MNSRLVNIHHPFIQLRASSPTAFSLKYSLFLTKKIYTTFVLHKNRQTTIHVTNFNKHHIKIISKSNILSLFTTFLLLCGGGMLFFQLIQQTIVGIYDFHLLTWFQHHRPVKLTPLLQIISSYSAIIGYSILLAVYLYRDRENIFKISPQFRKAIYTIGGMIITTQAIKYWAMRPRPFITHDTIIKLSSGGNPSFPSGHTAEAFAIMIPLFLLYRHHRFSWLFLLWAALVAYTRMALGVHYPSDVLMAITISTTWSWIIYRKKIEHNFFS